MHPIHDDVLRFIESPADDQFDSLALAVFAHQYDCIPAYRRVCDQRGLDPGRVADWRAIPPVPALAFKQVDLSCSTPQRTFFSSGTTQGSEQRSRHAMPDLRLYRASAIAGLRRHLFPDVPSMRIASLVPLPEEWPHSSLAQMIRWAMDEFGAAGSGSFATGEHFDFDGFAESVRASERDGAPICIMTTTGGLIRFLDFCRETGQSFRLPHSSRIMDTGGTKGAPRVLSRNGLLQAIWSMFAIPGYFCVNEYGMSELSSQYYDNVVLNRIAGRVAHRAKVGPPWLRTRFLDPSTLQDVEPGVTGLICHVDLANAGTALVVLTEDIGRSSADGFEILGRAQGAEARGCSMALAEFLAVRG